jgi:hypothetical protein
LVKRPKDGVPMLLRDKDEVRKVLMREGFEQQRMDDALAELPDPIDIDRHGDVLMRYGITRDSLTDLLGGSSS